MKAVRWLRAVSVLAYTSARDDRSTVAGLWRAGAAAGVGRCCRGALDGIRFECPFGLELVDAGTPEGRS